MPTGRRSTLRLYRRGKTKIMASDELFMDKYRIASSRAKWHGYDDGDYFITICVDGHRQLLGKIEDDRMFLSPIGLIVEREMESIPQHYPYAQILRFVVMPNHVHFILRINRDIFEEGSVSPVAVVVRGFKSAVTRQARVIYSKFAWQARFYDHIIRNDKEMSSINNYIIENVRMWRCDKLNPLMMGKSLTVL